MTTGDNLYPTVPAAEHPDPDCPRNSDDPLGTACACDVSTTS